MTLTPEDKDMANLAAPFQLPNGGAFLREDGPDPRNGRVCTTPHRGSAPGCDPRGGTGLGTYWRAGVSRAADLRILVKWCYVSESVIESK